MAELAPVPILQEGTEERKGEKARMVAFIGAIAITDLVKTTLGPKGMDKILQSASDGRVQVTNDGATILRSLILDNPAAKVLVDISKVQDEEVGDGTTSVCILAGELLREAEKLMAMKLHPQTIIDGFRKAKDVALDALSKSVIDNGEDPVKFREDLLNIARTTLSSKIVTGDRDHFAELAVDAVLRLKGSLDLESIQIIKKQGGTLEDSFLDDGFIIEKKIGVGQPKRLENAKILVANTPMDTDKPKIFGARIKVSSISQLAELEKAEKDKMKKKCEQIISHKCNMFINRQLIYNYPEQIFTDAGIMSIEHADFDGIERVSLVTGGQITSTFENPEQAVLGECDLIEEVIIGEDKMIKFSGCKKGNACTIVLRGSSQNILDEADRSLHDALCVIQQTVKNTKTVLGGGCSEMLMAQAVDESMKHTPGKISMAIESFAKALRQIPTIIADNAGFDSSELVSSLRAEHYAGNNTAGLDMANEKVGNVAEIGVTESYKVKSQAIQSAAEAAEMIMRVDNIIQIPPRQRGEEQGMM